MSIRSRRAMDIPRTGAYTGPPGSFTEAPPMTRFALLLPLAAIALSLSLALPLAGCGGGGAKTQVSQSSATMGQELTDLKTARDQGLISDKEYERAKRDILKRYKG
ncbi:MAG: SHOCT domain-containing protein [Alphaproteobacteria bacterium]|nr:SHOCT domain-containing protein [Alphaproteobacteria bacterium]